MLAFYLQIKMVHIAMALASGGLFAVRGALVLAGVRAAMATPVRWLSYAIDTTLLTAALMLLTALKLNPFVVPWLGVKLTALVIYIVLGTFALKRGRTRRVQGACYVAALLVFGFMYSVARAHHPLGVFAGMF